LILGMGSADSSSSSGLNSTASNVTISYTVRLQRQSMFTCVPPPPGSILDPLESIAAFFQDPVHFPLFIGAYIIMSMLIPAFDLLMQGWRGRSVHHVASIWTGNVLWLLTGISYVEYIALELTGLTCMATMIFWQLGRSIRSVAVAALMPFGRTTRWRSKRDINACDAFNTFIWHTLYGGFFICHFACHSRCCILCHSGIVSIGIAAFQAGGIGFEPSSTVRHAILRQRFTSER
jgi:uncharacterized membrane protein YccF (DUF307 family)